MVESFFGLSKRPFCVAPNLDSYVPTASCQGAIEASVRCVTRSEGPSLIIGGAGLGKTICAMKIAQMLESTMQVVVLASSQICTRRALIQSILYHLGLPHREDSEGALRIELHERLTQPIGTGEAVALVIDEAQSLSIKLLEEIRILSNTLCRGNPVVHVVLVGSLKLEDTLSHPQMESLNQRIVARNYLSPLSHPETLEYLRRKIQLAGGKPENIFETPAFDAIYRASQGVPRLIEQLADQAILQSGLESRKPIDADRIGKVWTQLHQLPIPWSDSWSESANSRFDSPGLDSPQEQPEERSEEIHREPSMDSDQDASVEFGALDEDPSGTHLASSTNFFESFIQDPIGSSAVSPPRAWLASDALEKPFGQLIKELNLAAIELRPEDRVFSSANQDTIQQPKPVAQSTAKTKAATYELVGISVDGDDRDMLVVIEDQGWVNPFAIR